MKEIQTIIGNTKAGIALVGLMLITLVSSCSKSDGFDEQYGAEAGAPIAGVSTYATHFEENITNTRADGELTRAWTPPTGFSAYDDGDQPIAIAFTQDEEAPMMGHFFKSSGKWRTSVEGIVETDYYLYGYIPNLPAITYTVTDKEGNNAKYSEGAKVKLENVPTVMPQDLCVVIGAREGANADTDAGIRKGDFKYHAQAITTDGENKVDGGNYVFLLFDHLYAALRIKMRVYSEYNAIRTIKLKSLQLNTQAGETTTKQKNDITITLNNSDGGNDTPIENIDYEQTGADIDGGIEFWSSQSGVQLNTDYQEFVGHFMPQHVTTLILTSIYDVYDTQGNLIRENCKATNTMELKDLLTGQEETLRGKRYTVNMTIRPTYLYMLSEPDLNDPTVTVN